MVELSPNVVALLVLLGFVAGAIVFTLAFVVVVDRSVANTRARSEQELPDEEQRDPGPR